MHSRRSFLRTTFSASLAASLRAGAAEKLPPVRQITRGPKFHWFAYYDKFQFDPTNRFALAHQVDFEHRSPVPDDVIQIGMVDLQDNDRWIELGETRAWNWQQGAMLQWVPGTESTILWNDREGDHFVCRVMDVRTRQRRTLPNPVYAISPAMSGFFATPIRTRIAIRNRIFFACRRSAFTCLDTFSRRRNTAANGGVTLTRARAATASSPASTARTQAGGNCTLSICVN